MLFEQRVETVAGVELVRASVEMDGELKAVRGHRRTSVFRHLPNSYGGDKHFQFRRFPVVLDQPSTIE